MIRAVIFDCFGVIISDALEVICTDLRANSPEVAVQVRDLVHASNRGMMTSRDSSEQIASLLGLTYEEYRQQIADGEAKNTAVLAYISELRKTCKTAMLSNIGAGSLARRFEPGELEQYFDAIVASGEIGFAKPEAEAYEITADRLGVRLDECVFTDDRELYCDAARGVGMQAILFKDLEQFRSDLEALLSQFAT